MAINSIKVPHLDISKFDAVEFTDNLNESEEETENYSFLKLMKDLDLSSKKNQKFEEVGLILYGMGMAKYVKTFFNEKIDLDTFLRLKENDFEELGISAEDTEIILKNLKFHQKDLEEFDVCENQNDDLKIAKNIHNLLILQQNYCTYVNLQMKKHKLQNYQLSTKESAVTYLKAFTESAIKQAELINQMLYDPKSDSHLIGKALEANNMELPKHLKEKLVTKKGYKKIGKKIVKSIIIGTGLVGISIFVGKQFIKKS